MAKRGWRRHSDEFKVRVIALALQPHTSMASIALANGINANMLRRWVQAFFHKSAPSTTNRGHSSAQALSFVQLPIQLDKLPATTPEPVTSGVIEVQIQRGDTKVVAGLPMSSDSAAWLREVLG